MSFRLHALIPLVALACASLASADAAAQAARVGRLRLLELPPPGVGTCRHDPVTPALQHGGVERLITFQSSDSTGHRLISLGLRANGTSVMLMALMGTDEGRRGESESVSVFFGVDGAILDGRRRAFTTGTPARRSDDRQLGLLPADTAAIRRLDAALRRRCRRPAAPR